MCNGNESSPRQRFVKGHKAAIKVFPIVKNLQGTIREEEVNDFPNEMFKFLFLQFMFIQYFTLKLFVIKYFEFGPI